jgi:hypothetical protein
MFEHFDCPIDDPMSLEFMLHLLTLRERLSGCSIG